MRSLKLDWATLKEGMGLGCCIYLKMNAQDWRKKRGGGSKVGSIFNRGGLISLDDRFRWTLCDQVHWGTRLDEWVFWVYRLKKHLSSELMRKCSVFSMFHISSFFWHLQNTSPTIQSWESIDVECVLCVCRGGPVIVYSLPTNPCRWRPGFLVSALLNVGYC